MSDRIFYVGSQKDRRFTGYVPAKFITLNGQHVVDPTPGGSQNAYIYADGSDKYKTRGEIANPNNYLIVPANYTEQQTRAFAADVANTLNQVYPEDTTGTMGATRANAQMSDAFSQGGSQDLQRNPQWGIPKGSVVPAFVGSASYHLGSVTRWSGMPRELAEIGGGMANLENRYIKQPLQYLKGGEWGSIDTSGPHFLSQHNYANLSKGYADADVPRNAASPISDFGYRPQAQYPAGQIGDGNGLGVGDWRFPLAGIDPSNPLRPVSPPQTGGTLEKYLEKFSDRSVQPWTDPPVRGLPDNSARFGNSFGSGGSSPASGSTDIPALPAPEPQNPQGSAFPYAGEYDQYQRQLNGNRPLAPMFDPTKPPPPFDPSNPYPPLASGSIGDWIRSLAGVDPEHPAQFVPPIFSPLYRR
jgi:hypothetical protein